MSKVSTYLNFPHHTEEAFNFYKSVFGGEFSGGGIMRFGDVPGPEGAPPMPEHVRNLVMHMELPILGGHVLMGSDAPESFGLQVSSGNNVHIMLQPDDREETRHLFDALAAGGQVTQELADMFWGDFYGSCQDRYGVHWMFNCSSK